MSSSRACAHAGRVVLLCTCGPRRFSPFPSPQKGGNGRAQRPCGGWALTVCLCSYDARFSCGVQVVVRLGVLRFGHRVWRVCCGVPLLIAPLPLACYPLPCLLIPPAPRLIGAPLFREGWDVCRSPPPCRPTPLCCGLPHCLCAPPRACTLLVCRHTL